ncbi:MAG: PHP domain-containing protein [Candidatus Nealsonbacteria bacterium]|nr:PHP domain-containing protein [Candidatus Nealsonbacteria bacterium]
MNNNSKNLQEGIQFKKLDLHVHTYKSYNDFERDGVSDNDLQQLADKICQTAKDKGLSGIAITDHNTGEAVDEIKTANEKLKTGLTIIPGTEVDVFEGFHVICLFPNKTTSAQIRDWLIGLGMDASNIGKTDFAPSKNTTLQAVRESVDKLNGLMVAAHADSSNQSLFSAKKSSGSKFVEGKMDVAKFDAIETKNIQRLKSNYSQFIEGYAIYQASDNHRQNQDGTQGKHCYSTIGEPYTWFKLDEISVDGLRQCFIDPEVRIKQIDEWKPEMLDGVPRILSLEIKTKNGFFADGEKFIFNTDINSFLGGKGAGKSLVLEYLRFVLNDIANDDYIKQDSVYKLIATLGCGGKVIIQVQTEHGDIYVFAREFDPKKISEPVITRGQKLTPELCERIFASSQTSVASKDGVLKPNLDARQLFPIVAYSQTEIFTLARDKQSQLKSIKPSF